MTQYWWWLSFCDNDRPRGSQFLGVAIVGPVGDMIDAVRIANAMEANPGGEVRGQALPDDWASRIPPAYRMRLLSRDDLDALKRVTEGVQ